MTTLINSIATLPKVGKTTAQSLRRIGIETVRDLLFHFPYRYLDFSVFSAISSVKEGEVVTIRGTIKTITSRFSFRGRMSLAEAIISDATGSLKVVWFNQPYLAKTLKSGDEVLLSGVINRYKTLQMQNPVYEKVAEETIHTGRLVPVYHATENLYNRTIRTLVKHCLPIADTIEDPVPNDLLTRYRLPSLAETIKILHFPPNAKSLISAQKRIIFDEVLIQQLAVQLHKKHLAATVAPVIAADIDYIKQFLSTLPFTLTIGQKKALWDIVKDMNKAMAMNRLLEGDVGSGKTLVALVAALLAAHSGKQVVLLAPTEILAQQHYQSFRTYLRSYPFPIALYTRTFRWINDNTLTKAEMNQNIADGNVSLIIGTHALLQGTMFNQLGLVIIDEQHRFGVSQRSLLLKQTKHNKQRPHLLSMTATPIPRTLALSLYSNLDISILSELPQGRQPITTSVITGNQRQATYGFIKNQIVAGRQVFIVTARVEESEASNVKSAKAELIRLQKEIFPNLKLGLIHGKMKGTEKEAMMTDFHDRKLDILVATSVIEIGIDVPNATVIVIEDADRFGLAQLHQLRGRVGRGKHQSYCFLFTQSTEQKTLERLAFFSQNTDGFKLAEHDLKQRGFGSLFGIQQTGFDFKFARYLTIDVFKIGQEAARTLLSYDPYLKRSSQLKNQVDPLLKQIHLE